MDYSRWTKEALVKRIQYLEGEREASRAKRKEPGDGDGRPASEPTAKLPKAPKTPKAVDPSRYHFRYVAIKLAYLGKRYSGFEYQPSGTLPAVEEELWKALVKGCLVFPAAGMSADEVDFGVCEYSKCGRTDRGVSAFGQVVALRVRSNGADGSDSPEIDYGKVLNRLLPPDIRVLAWCLRLPADFSARFSCRERRYRYFFTQPAFFPGGVERSVEGTVEVDGSVDDRVAQPGWLDIEAMREAAAHFVGLHDFRNFCKLDPKKQITNFARRIFSADIVAVPDVNTSLECFGPATGSHAGSSAGSHAFPQVYSFDVRGSAFLWHQIRHMVAVLFLVGQGRESPSVVPALLDAQANPGRPAYGMAEEAPLVLWDCIFPALPPVGGESAGGAGGARDEDGDDVDDADKATALDSPAAGQWSDSLDWIYVSDDLPQSRVFADQLWRGWRAAKMDEILANRLLNVVTGGGGGGDGDSFWVGDDASQPQTRTAIRATAGPPVRASKSVLFEGGDGPRQSGNYVPLLQRHRLAAPEEVNDKFARQKGFASAEAMRETGNWRAVIKAQKEAAAAAAATAAAAAASEDRADGPE